MRKNKWTSKQNRLEDSLEKPPLTLRKPNYFLRGEIIDTYSSSTKHYLWIILGLLCLKRRLNYCDLNKSPDQWLSLFSLARLKSRLLGSCCPIKNEPALVNKSREDLQLIYWSFENMSFCQVKGFKVKTSLIPGPVIAAETLRNCVMKQSHLRSCYIPPLRFDKCTGVQRFLPKPHRSSRIAVIFISQLSTKNGWEVTSVLRKYWTSTIPRTLCNTVEKSY